MKQNLIALQLKNMVSLRLNQLLLGSENLPYPQGCFSPVSLSPLGFHAGDFGYETRSI
jgi:hypothetical protein